MRFLLFVVVAVLATCAAPQKLQKVHRVPLEKSQVVLKSPTEYEKRGLRYDHQTGEPISSYDPKPRVEVVDARSGKYAFKWIGYDGKEKVIAYQRADAIDAIVSASVDKSANGKYLYTYIVENLPSSATYLSYFIVQNFSTDAKPVELNGKATNLADLRVLNTFRQVPSDGKPKNIQDIFIGEMSSEIQRFKEGNWIAFAILPDFEPTILPGRRLELKLVSNAVPGLVGCSVTAGNLTLKGVGEHMPTELENVMPGYEELPRGYTIGPVDSLKTLSATEHVKYIIDRLPQFEKLGWITPSARKWYEENLPGRASSQYSIERSKTSNPNK